MSNETANIRENQGLMEFARSLYMGESEGDEQEYAIVGMAYRIDQYVTVCIAELERERDALLKLINEVNAKIEGEATDGVNRLIEQRDVARQSRARLVCLTRSYWNLRNTLHNVADIVRRAEQAEKDAKALHGVIRTCSRCLRSWISDDAKCPFCERDEWEQLAREGKDPQTFEEMKQRAETAEQDAKAFREALIDMVNQHCQFDKRFHGLDGIVLMDMALSANEDAIYLLMEQGYLERIRPDKDWYRWTEKVKDT